MADSRLNLGNLANQVKGLGPNAMQNEARNLALGNTFAMAADTLAGKDYQPGMSGLQQALIAGARGASTGFQNKAAIEKAKGQDELNAWVQSLAEKERQDTEAADYQEKINTSEKQAAVPALSAFIAYREGKMDKQTYLASQKNIIGAMIRARGEELVAMEPEGDDMSSFGMQVRDPDTGQVTTSVKSLSALIQYALEQNEEIGRAAAASLGQLPSDYFESKKDSGSDITLEQYSTMTPEQQRAYREFKSGKPEESGKRVSPVFGEKGMDEVYKKRGEVRRGASERAAALGRIERVQQLLAEGTQTGALTEFSAQALGTVGTLLGVDFSSVENVAQLNNALKGQLPGILSIFGAGTGISNRDVENAQLIIGSVENPADALRKIQAYAGANLVLTNEYAKLLTEVDAASARGELTDQQVEQKIAEFENGMFSRLQQLYNQELDKALGMQQNFLRTGSTSGAAPQQQPQEITIDLDGNIVE